MDLQTFRKKLAFELIHNNHLLYDEIYSVNDSIVNENSGRKRKRYRISYAIKDHKF